MSMMDLLAINVEKVEKEMATESFIDEYFDMIATEAKLDYGSGVTMAGFGEFSLESAIEGSTVANKMSYYFAKLGNIFTKRQSGFNNAISQMQQINTTKIGRGPSTIGLNVENATEYARITAAFNPQMGDKNTAEWQTLMNEMDAAMDDAAWEPLRQYWQGFKERVYSALSFATIILFPLGIYFWVKSLISEIRFWVALYNLAIDKAEKDIMLVKGIKLIQAIITEIIGSIYFRICPKNPMRLSKNMSSADLVKAANAIVQTVQNLKTKLNRKLPVEYEDKVKAAEIVYDAAATVYKEKLHMVSPAGIKAVTSGAEALSDKVFASVEGYHELKTTVSAYKSMIVASELYFDVTNKVLLDLFKM